MWWSFHLLQTIPAHSKIFLSNLWKFCANFSRALIRKVWSSESKAFSMSVVTKYPFTFIFSVTLKKSEISLPDALIHPCETEAVCWNEIRFGSTFTAYLQDVTNILLTFAWFNKFINSCFSSSQKVLENSFVKPSFPGDFLLLKLFIARITSLSQTFFLSWLKVGSAISLSNSVSNCKHVSFF